MLYPPEVEFEPVKFPIAWPCGHSKWQHGDGDDVCEEWVPERKPSLHSHANCPVVCLWKSWREYHENTRAIAAVQALLGKPDYSKLSSPLTTEERLAAVRRKYEVALTRHRAEQQMSARYAVSTNIVKRAPRWHQHLLSAAARATNPFRR
jgi:hypothetical protein